MIVAAATPTQAIATSAAVLRPAGARELDRGGRIRLWACRGLDPPGARAAGQDPVPELRVVGRRRARARRARILKEPRLREVRSPEVFVAHSRSWPKHGPVG